MTREEEYEKRKRESGPKEVPLPSRSQSYQGDSSKKRRADVNSNPILKAYDISSREKLEEEIARMFCTGGLPFNLARYPHYFRSYSMAANMNLPCYTKLRTTLIVKDKAYCERLLQPIQATGKDEGVTIVSDGWSDPTRKPLINFMASSGKGPVFLKTVHCFGQIKDKFFISELMKEVNESVGSQNVVQVITMQLIIRKLIVREQEN
uniref:DUF659 domain-containing protein n=1 Tax=Chenopodium quinoa TaxID=63459 RepID=A0A803N3K7_CHEQI